ncbi:helix-turn-helix transcriptional regulator [Longispora albida]|uniref:helix-turn-helix transcriptional regulator n=1 Tax=Longispora albida TaxID=203523 RepID=UPI0004780AAB|nr:AAA family ATPase [Longispora albida]
MINGLAGGSGFVGRLAELGALEEAYARSLAGGAQVVLVRGEAGIGKTRLVAEFADRLGPGVRVLTGLCPESAGLPHAPFVTVARELVRELGADHVAAALPGGARRLARWLPALGPADEDSGPTGRSLLYEEVLALLEHAAESVPTVLVLEDLHWADVSTAELTSFLGRNLRRPGLLLIATFRPEEDSGITALHSGLARSGAVRLELARFDREEVRLLLRALTGREPDPAAVARVHRRSEGIPLFVEALDPDSDATPDSARDLLLAGMTQMGDRSRTVLRGASALGREVSHPVLARVVGLPGPELDEALRPLLDRRLLVVSGHGYAFRHALIRAAAYETLLPGERVRLHTRCAEALEAESAPAAELAAHWHAAGDRERTAVAGRRAAEEARRSCAPAERLRALELVLSSAETTDLLEVLEQAVDACQHAGEYPRGVELATAALELLDPATDAERVASMLEIRGRLRFRSNADGGPDLAAAGELLPAEGLSVVRGRVLSTLASARIFPDGPDSELRTAEETIAIGEATGDLVLQARGHLLLAMYRARTGSPDWQPPLTEAARLAGASGDHDLLLTVCLYECDVAARLGELASAEAAARRGLAVARRFGQDRGRGATLESYLVETLAAQGRWPQARALITEALAAEPPLLVRCVLVAARGSLDTAQGLWPQAQAALAEVEEIREASGRPDLLVDDWLYLALRMAVEPESGVPAGPVLAALYTAEDLDPIRISLADAARIASPEDREALRELLDRQTPGGPVSDAHVAEARAALDDAGPETWLAVAAAWRALGQPYPTARALTDAGRAAARTGDPDTAREALTEAATLAAGLGAVPLAARIADLLEPQPAPQAPLGLTDREREVLTLVARGLSNRQLARELGISPNTAGVHVSRILAKLGASSRTEAAAIAHRAGW